MMMISERITLNNINTMIPLISFADFEKDDDDKEDKEWEIIDQYGNDDRVNTFH